MARDIEKNALLYFYDNESGIFTGEVGTAGDSDDFTLPSGMTTIAPPSFLETQQAIFDTDLQTWSVEYINPYDGWAQAEKDIWDANQVKQAAIDEAQDVVDSEIAKAVYGITTLLQKYIPNLTSGEERAIEVFRTKYENWIERQQ